jgi:DNA-binding NarL/FixJ family response regulator
VARCSTTTGKPTSGPRRAPPPYGHEILRDGYGHAMNVTRRRRPVRVTLAHECELVTVGFAGLLAPYAHRVQVLPSPGGVPARGADLTLHDTLAGVQALPLAVVRSVAHDGLLVAWTWNARPELVELALGNGVSGVLSKALPAARLVAALESIHRGRPVVDLGTDQPAASSGHSTAHSSETLTPRAAQVIAMITQGLDNQTIAERASISINSLKSYIRSAYRKMGVTSRSQAVLWGVRHGYLGSVVTREQDDPALTRSAGA